VADASGEAARTPARKGIYMSTPGRAARLDEVLAGLLRDTPHVEAAAIVSFDGLPMASALPAEMDQSRVAAMSAALLSLGERAAEGLGRGDLSQVYIEGAGGTVFLVSAEGEAVLVAVAGTEAKVGLVLYELRRAATSVGAALRGEDSTPASSFDGAHPVGDFGAATTGNGHTPMPSPDLLPTWSPGVDQSVTPTWS
jgi:predicted regulator of Ras-like GTPase activity (Roadblock/LC7/MglB family)